MNKQNRFAYYPACQFFVISEGTEKEKGSRIYLAIHTALPKDHRS